MKHKGLWLLFAFAFVNFGALEWSHLAAIGTTKVETKSHVVTTTTTTTSPPTTTTTLPDPSPLVPSQELGTSAPIPVVNDLPLSIIQGSPSFPDKPPLTRSVFRFRSGWIMGPKKSPVPFLEHQGENSSCGTFPVQLSPGTTVKMVTTDPKLAGKLDAMIGETTVEICNVTKTRIYDPLDQFWLEVTPPSDTSPAQ